MAFFVFVFRRFLIRTLLCLILEVRWGLSSGMWFIYLFHVFGGSCAFAVFRWDWINFYWSWSTGCLQCSNREIPQALSSRDGTLMNSLTKWRDVTWTTRYVLFPVDHLMASSFSWAGIRKRRITWWKTLDCFMANIVIHPACFHTCAIISLSIKWVAFCGT